MRNQPVTSFFSRMALESFNCGRVRRGEGGQQQHQQHHQQFKTKEVLQTKQRDKTKQTNLKQKYVNIRAVAQNDYAKNGQAGS